MIMRTTLILRTLAPALSFALFTSACTSESAEADTVDVVVSTSILGDIVANIVGDDAEVEVLMPTGADPHEFEPSARQVAAIRSADLVIANGLGLEEGLGRVLEEAAGDGVFVLEIAPLVDPRPLGDDAGNLDPHVWLDPTRMAMAVDFIASALSDSEPTVDWAAHAEPYRRALIETDEWVRRRLASIPPEARLLVTSHQAFGYFADRYDFEVIATILPGATTMVEPSAAGFAEAVKILEVSGSPAVFTDWGENQALAEQLAVQVRRPVFVVPLYTGALGDNGSGAETYIEMLRWNANAIGEAFE
jgi:zinc/manganese transport system substrate-binding protein